VEIIEWANKKGYTIRLTDDEAKSLSRQLEDPNVTKIELENLDVEIGA